MADFFRARPIQLQAARWAINTPIVGIAVCDACPELHGVTPTGAYVKPGEWVAKDAAGRLYVFGEDEFRALFEPMN